MIKIYKNYNIKKLNTFNIDVYAKYFVEIKSIEDLKELILLKEFRENDYLFLGGGSNVLFTKNYNGIIILNKLKGIKIIKEDKNKVFINSSSGELWHDLVLFCVNKNLWGIENLALIPGTVGASPVQNIGAYGVELKDILYNVVAYKIDKKNKKIKKKFFTNKECKFGYRDSIFKNKLKNKYFISGITIILSKNKKINVNYKDLQNYIKENKKIIKKSKDISKMVENIRVNKLPNTKEYGNAGSFFKNVYITKKKLKELLVKYEDMPHFKEGHRVKIPTAWLIEKCNFKGKRFDNVGIYHKQALIIIHYGGGKGINIKRLSDKIIREVYKKFGILISPEVNLI